MNNCLKRWNSTLGALNLEFLFVFPVLLIIFGSVMELSMVMFQDSWSRYATVRVSKEEARKLALLSTPPTCAEIAVNVSNGVKGQLENNYGLHNVTVEAAVMNSIDHPYAVVVLDVETPRSCLFCNLFFINSSTEIITQFDVENSGISC